MRSPFVDEQGFPAFKPDIVIEGDQTKELNGLSFEFIQIPGHSPGSMAIKVTVDGKTLMFTGDALQPNGNSLEQVTFGWQGDPNFSRQAIVDSMYKLAQYETDMVLPGHGKVCVRNGTKVLEQAARIAFATLR
jgi:glyoxylase-like metal-dependent hydrolase (beta-lactamase superfamily II)